METIKFNTLTFKIDEIKKAVEKCLNKNYRVVIFQKENISQIYVENSNKNICTIHNNFGLVNVSSVHKANRVCGTGYRVFDDLCNISLNQIDIACNTFCVNWAQSDRKHIVKHSSIDDIAKNCSLTYKEIIL